jgi:hypothetical protein
MIQMEIAAFICGGYYGTPNACSDVTTDAKRRECARAVVNAYVGVNVPYRDRIHYPCRAMCEDFYERDSSTGGWDIPEHILRTLAEFIRRGGYTCATPRQPNE